MVQVAFEVVCGLLMVWLGLWGRAGLVWWVGLVVTGLGLYVTAVRVVDRAGESSSSG